MHLKYTSPYAFVIAVVLAAVIIKVGFGFHSLDAIIVFPFIALPLILALNALGRVKTRK